MVDNWDGTYALQFALPIAGDWELSAAVGLNGVPCAAAASVRAEYGPLTAEDCEIENVDGIVACGTSDPIFIQVLCPAACCVYLIVRVEKGTFRSLFSVCIMLPFRLQAPRHVSAPPLQHACFL